MDCSPTPTRNHEHNIDPVAVAQAFNHSLQVPRGNETSNCFSFIEGTVWGFLLARLLALKSPLAGAPAELLLGPAQHIESTPRSAGGSDSHTDCHEIVWGFPPWVVQNFKSVPSHIKVDYSDGTMLMQWWLFHRHVRRRGLHDRGCVESFLNLTSF